MKDKFSIEEFVEDSVPSLDENDKAFQSISDEFEKRINSIPGGKTSLMRARIKGKIERIRSSIVPDTSELRGGVDAPENEDFRATEGEEDFSSFADENDNDNNDNDNNDNGYGNVSDTCEAAEEEKSDIWTGSVLDRLRSFGYIKVADEPAESSIFFDDLDDENASEQSDEYDIVEDEAEENVDCPEETSCVAYEPASWGSDDFADEFFREKLRDDSEPVGEPVGEPVEEFVEEQSREEDLETKFRRSEREGQSISVRRKNSGISGKNRENSVNKADTEKKTAPATYDVQKVVGYEKLTVIPKREYVYPPVELIRPDDVFNISDREKIAKSEEETRYKANKLVETLKSFGIGITITGITRGPSVTRFEFQPEIGVRISKIVSLTDDIALSLAASAVRMEAPIPGKSAIGIEIPNETVDTVYLYDVINSTEYRNAKSKISFALGKDIEGKIVVADLAKMPHVLIAGSTGSGKSVCINTIISGILYGASPEDVKFIMIDPKVVELGMYNDIPHLLIPVVTEPKKAASALAWAVGEVERRYHLFAEHSVRDIFSFNKARLERDEMSSLEKMPQIVIIIDELADLMMVASQDVEKSIIRLAQKARAAGVHLVIATQRPSVDVITGLIKANIPSRIAFAVASSFDSRTILDSIGAEKLLGRGDMLYHPIGVAKSKRVQGAFISETEVERITEFVKNSYGAPEFNEEIKQSIDRGAEEMTKGASSVKNQKGDNEGGCDADEELMMVAAELGLKQKQLSASNLQRKLKLGYSRAARIIDKLEEIGFLTEADGSKPRQVLMTEAEWIAYNSPAEDFEEDNEDEDYDE